MATDALYQLYLDHYADLEDGFSLVRDWYGVDRLEDAGIGKLSQTDFQLQLRKLARSPDVLQNWLIRMLRGREDRRSEIEHALRTVLGDVAPGLTNEPSSRRAAS